MCVRACVCVCLQRNDRQTECSSSNGRLRCSSGVDIWLFPYLRVCVRTFSLNSAIGRFSFSQLPPMHRSTHCRTFGPRIAVRTPTVSRHQFQTLCYEPPEPTGCRRSLQPARHALRRLLVQQRQHPWAVRAATTPTTVRPS